MVDFLPIMMYTALKRGEAVKFLSVAETAKKWGKSERTVRSYCAQGKIEGAFLTGKTWNIPDGAIKPQRERFSCDNALLKCLIEQQEVKLKSGIYHKTQVELAYNSNHIEGSKLTEEQTRFIFETNTVGVTDRAINVDDVIESTNHFRCFDYIVANAKKPLTEAMIKKMHQMLKSGTSQERKDWFKVGDYKKLPNEIGGQHTTPPENVQEEMRALLGEYNLKKGKTIEDVIDFHQRFEKIHPFQDGNGRVGRLIMFKECLASNIVPFIITDDLKMYYYRGLREWENERGFLLDTCLTAQDRYKAKLDYFKIDY